MAASFLSSDGMKLRLFRRAVASQSSFRHLLGQVLEQGHKDEAPLLARLHQV